MFKFNCIFGKSVFFFFYPVFWTVKSHVKSHVTSRLTLHLITSYYITSSPSVITVIYCTAWAMVYCTAWAMVYCTAWAMVYCTAWAMVYCITVYCTAWAMVYCTAWVMVYCTAWAMVYCITVIYCTAFCHGLLYHRYTDNILCLYDYVYDYDVMLPCQLNKQ